MSKAFTTSSNPEPRVASAGEQFTSERAGIGFLLVGHGTRRIAGQAQLRTVHQDFAIRVHPFPSGMAFLELADPDIPTAVAELARRGVTRLITVPVLLFSAGHAENDIPTAVAAATAAHRIDPVSQVAPVECCPPMLELSAQRFRETVCRSDCPPLEAAAVRPAEEFQQIDISSAPAAGCSLSSCSEEPSCSGKHCPQVGLLMLGRGSSSATATEQMRRFTQLRRERTPVAWCETGFIHAQMPTVEMGLDALAASHLPTLVVQPHLLFEGELIEKLRRQVALRQAQQPEKHWLITEALGADARLAWLLAELALDELAKQAG